jgi:hypothetical protein
MVLFVCALSLAGCDQVTDLLEKGAEAVGEASNTAATANMSEDDKLGAKMEGYIDCINGPSSRVLDAAERYASWVDIKGGVTGEEKNVYGIYDHELNQSCVDGINNANAAEPKDEALEKAATAWLDAYKAVQPLIHDAHDYYDREDYKDDGFAKGKEMHDGLAAAISAFQDADQALRRVVGDKNDALQARRLEQLEKEEGRKLRFQAANVMAKAKELMAAGDASSLDALDLERFDKALKAYDAALEEADKYVKANEAEADTVLLFDSFVDTGEDYLKAAKEMMRRKRDNRAYDKMERSRLGTPSGWMVEGSPDKLSRAYNDLVNRSNGLNWMNYNPNP